MGLFSSIRKKEKIEEKVNQYFELIPAYTPTFTSFEGGLYEMDLTRSAIHSFATHVSKLKPEVQGPAAGNAVLAKLLQFKPNGIMDTKKYLYRMATIYMVENNVIIAPLKDELGRICGYYPVLPSQCQMVEYDGAKYYRYNFGRGQYGAFEVATAGMMNQFQYRDEMFGSGNAPLGPTMELIQTNNQGVIEGVKASATIRFIAKLANSLKDKDIETEKQRFVKSNLSAQNNGGVLMIDQKYEDVKQIESSPYTVNASQMKQIKENIFDYFGTNDKIMHNAYSSNEWSAYYEGKIEPFAIEASLVHTNMTFTEHQVAFGNQIIFTANRLQYLSNDEKLQTVTQLFDRGFITHNMGLEIYNMAPIEGGDKRYIRKEYDLAQNYGEEQQTNE